MSKFPLVLVEWEDSFSPGSLAGWKWETIDPAELDEGCVICYSVGWLIRDDEKLKVLVPHANRMGICEPDGYELHAGGRISIPARSVVRLVRLVDPSA